MPTLKKIKPQSEKELHGIIEKEIDALEEGLEILKYEFAMKKGIPDFLCVDSGGRLVIIEVKLQEDEGILFQALRYYNEIDREIYTIARIFSENKVNPERHPRILLIAERFSDDIKQLSTLVKPEVELYEYTVLCTPDDKRGICYHPVPLIPRGEDITKPSTLCELREYITKEPLKPLFDKLIDEIKSIGEGIKEYTTQSYVGFKYRGQQIAYLTPYRKSLDISVVIIDENSRRLDYKSIRLESPNENYGEIFDNIKKSFENKGGKASEGEGVPDNLA